MSDAPPLNARPTSAPTGAVAKRRTRHVPPPPTKEEAAARLAAWAAKPLPPWLTPEALAEADRLGLPDVSGPVEVPRKHR